MPTKSDYDFILTVATIALSMVIGALFVGGTLYTFFAAQADPAWTETLMYANYVQAMNSYLLPLLVALIVTLGLCIPRRIFKRRILVGASVGLVLITLGLMAFAGLRAGWLFLLACAAAVQLVVIVLTAARSKRLTYLQEGFLIRMGSAVLHLGFVVLVAAFVLGMGRAVELGVFWVATLLVMIGMVMSLYSTELGAIGRRFRTRETPAGD